MYTTAKIVILLRLSLQPMCLGKEVMDIRESISVMLPPFQSTSWCPVEEVSIVCLGVMVNLETCKCTVVHSMEQKIG